MIASHDCPNCGANVRDDGASDVVRCGFCGTHITLPRARRAASRRELEEERTRILARESEWAERIKEASNEVYQTLSFRLSAVAASTSDSSSPAR